MSPPGPALERLLAQLRRLPGVGERTAQRLAYHLLQVDRSEARGLAEALLAAAEQVVPCGRCHGLDEQDPCRVCRDPTRDASVVLVVEDPRDMAAFEGAGHRGLYHVLGGRLSPLEGVTAQDLTVESLRRRVEAGGIREVVVATSPDLEGEATAAYILEALEGAGASVSRIARGIPAGASVRHMPTTILGDALRMRRPLPG